MQNSVVCDGVRNCPDGSDERICVPTISKFSSCNNVTRQFRVVK